MKGIAPSGIKPESMDVRVGDLKFNGNKADAVVSFAPKGGRISDGLTMRYGLELRDNEWVIVSRSGMDMKQHAGTMSPAPSTMDGNAGAVDPMPNAIPGVAPTSRPLPPGHPPLHETPPPASDGSPK